MSGPTRTTITKPEEISTKMKAIARRIRQQSALVRDTVKTIHRSGAIDELALAVREAAITARDVSQEIQVTAKELSDRGAIKEIAGAIEETSSMIRTGAAKAKSAEEVSSSPDMGSGAKEESKDEFSPIASQSSTKDTVMAARESERKTNQEAQQREQLVKHAQRKSRKKRSKKGHM